MHFLVTLLILLFFTTTIAPTPKEEITYYDLADNWFVKLKVVCGELQNSSYYKIADERQFIIIAYTYRGNLVRIEKVETNLADDENTLSTFSFLINNQWEEHDAHILDEAERDRLTEVAFKESGGEAGFATYMACKDYVVQDSNRRFPLALKEAYSKMNEAQEIE